MANQLFQQMVSSSFNPQVVQNVKGLMNLFNSGMNPQALMQNNPQLQQVAQLVNGRNPQQVFMSECQKRNIDPNTIINMLK